MTLKMTNNTTRYDSEALHAYFQKLWGEFRSELGRDYRHLTSVRYQYLNKPTSYERCRGWRKTHFSLDAQGWGNVLEEGDYPRVSISKSKRKGDNCLVVSIVRPKLLLGRADLEQLGAVALTDIPESVMPHFAYAIEAKTYSGIRDPDRMRMDEVLSNLPVIAINAKAPKGHSTKARIGALKAKILTLEKEIRQNEAHSRKYKEWAEYCANEAKKATTALAAKRAELEGIEDAFLGPR
jgi:hypothetical protein